MGANRAFITVAKKSDNWLIKSASHTQLALSRGSGACRKNLQIWPTEIKFGSNFE